MVVQELLSHVSGEMGKVIVGQEAAINQIFMAYLAGGHIILEGVPGMAKTLIARTFAKILGKDFKRIQFTPDLMPSDILGSMVFNLQESRFIFHPGPVFTNILLADEINRTSPKTQSALLEAMQENQVTIEGKLYQVDRPFMVIATQNPIEFEGTYPLPEAQLDRFLMKVTLTYPGTDTEMAVLKKFRDGFDSNALEDIPLRILPEGTVEECRDEMMKVRVEDRIIQYIHELVENTRTNKNVLLGVSTRGSINLLILSRLNAALQGRDYVIPDDVKEMISPVFRHRLVLNAEADIEGFHSDDILREVVDQVEVPR